MSDVRYVCQHCGRKITIHPTYATPVCPVHGDVMAKRIETVIEWEQVPVSALPKRREGDGWVVDVPRGMRLRWKVGEHGEALAEVGTVREIESVGRRDG